jgi:hypothetical protein
MNEYKVRYTYTGRDGWPNYWAACASLTEALLSLHTFQKVLTDARIETRPVKIEGAAPGFDEGFEIIGPATGEVCAVACVVFEGDAQAAHAVERLPEGTGAQETATLTGARV